MKTRDEILDQIRKLETGIKEIQIEQENTLVPNMAQKFALLQAMARHDTLQWVLGELIPAPEWKIK